MTEQHNEEDKRLMDHYTSRGEIYKAAPRFFEPPTLGAKELRDALAKVPEEDNGVVKRFASGALRSSDVGKNAYEGFLSTRALEEFGDYMTRHRQLPDGSLRDADNWKKGMGLDSFIGSLFRHTLELVGLHKEGYVSRRIRRELPDKVHDLEFLKREIACAILFNIQGYLHELTQESPALVPMETQARALLERIYRRFEDA